MYFVNICVERHLVVMVYCAIVWTFQPQENRTVEEQSLAGGRNCEEMMRLLAEVRTTNRSCTDYVTLNPCYLRLCLCSGEGESEGTNAPSQPHCRGEGRRRAGPPRGASRPPFILLFLSS
jgi:hypothetical protein